MYTDVSSCAPSVCDPKPNNTWLKPINILHTAVILLNISAVALYLPREKLFPKTNPSLLSYPTTRTRAPYLRKSSLLYIRSAFSHAREEEEVAAAVAPRHDDEGGRRRGGAGPRQSDRSRRLSPLLLPLSFARGRSARAVYITLSVCTRVYMRRSPSLSTRRDAGERGERSRRDGYPCIEVVYWCVFGGKF